MGMLDVPTTKRFINDCVSFHFDIVQCLSRQYMISPCAFAMGGAMAGLLPVSPKTVQTYPEEGKYCRVINQHLVRRPFKIRFAEVSDLDALVSLESTAWSKELLASREVLRRRLETSPTTNLVVTMNDKIVAALYMQLIPSLETVFQETYMEISRWHSDSGRVMQLIAVLVDPSVAALGISSEVRGFALLMARLDPNIESVVGVTRCRDFVSYDGSMEEYMRGHVAGELTDPIVDFHTSYGARYVKLVEGFRQEDTDNDGIGVLIQYDVKSLSKLKSGGVTSEKPEVVNKTMPTMDLLGTIMNDLGYPMDRNDLGRGFFDYGMDSLELVRVRNKLSQALNVDLPATLLLDFPTAQDVAGHLDKERGFVEEKPSIQEGTTEEDKYLAPNWRTVTAFDIIDLQEKCKQVYASASYQKQFSEIAQKCYPDMIKYTMEIEPMLIEVEGKAMQQLGIIENADFEIVQENRQEFSNCIRKYWVQVPEVRLRSNELCHLTKQDQFWS